MKTPRIPNGWRKLRRDEILKEGDKCPTVKRDAWVETMFAGELLGEVRCLFPQNIYIRRIKQKKR